MESMVNQFNRETYRRWKVILEVERFISENDDDNFQTRERHYRNYFCQLLRLLYANQLIIQRDDDNNIVGVCGWIKIEREDEWKINKLTWDVPENISRGNILYISFCILKGRHGLSPGEPSFLVPPNQNIV